MRKRIFNVIFSTIILLFTSVIFADITPIQYGPTQEKELLSQIAVKTRPNADITLEQMMIALFQTNPHAFADKNINLLYSGVKLRVPNSEEISSVDPHKAIEMVDAQNQKWSDIKAKKQKIISAPAIPESVETKSSTSRHIITLLLNEKFANVENQFSLMASQVQEFLLHAQQRVDTIAENQASMQNQVTAMTDRLQALSDQLEIQQVAIASLHKHSTSEKSAWEREVQNYQLYGGMAFGVVLLLLALMWAKIIRIRKSIERTQSQKSLTTKMSNDDPDQELEDEYDFINSAEGIPAKLDLARAYIDMDDMSSARKVLQEIIKHGNSDQQQDAKQLMSHIAVPV